MQVRARFLRHCQCFYYMMNLRHESVGLISNLYDVYGRTRVYQLTKVWHTNLTVAPAMAHVRALGRSRACGERERERQHVEMTCPLAVASRGRTCQPNGVSSHRLAVRIYSVRTFDRSSPVYARTQAAQDRHAVGTEFFSRSRRARATRQNTRHTSCRF
jgi:hypothetical protein